MDAEEYMRALAERRAKRAMISRVNPNSRRSRKYLAHLERAGERDARTGAVDATGKPVVHPAEFARVAIPLQSVADANCEFARAVQRTWENVQRGYVLDAHGNKFVVTERAPRGKPSYARAAMRAPMEARAVAGAVVREKETRDARDARDARRVQHPAQVCRPSASDRALRAFDAKLNRDR